MESLAELKLAPVMYVLCITSVLFIIAVFNNLNVVSPQSIFVRLFFIIIWKGGGQIFCRNPTYTIFFLKIFKIQMGVGTVGAVAVDAQGHIAVATSTGGMSGKAVGRIGDTPQIGSGTYADDNIGGVSTTGITSPAKLNRFQILK